MTSKSRRASPTPGDVFTIPFDEDLVGFGQVVATRMSAHLVLFDYKATTSEAQAVVELATQSVPIARLNVASIFLSDTSIFRDTSWAFLGNHPLYQDYPLPAHLVRSPGGVFVVDFMRQRRRPALAADVAVLDLYSDFSPGLVESVLASHFGVREWTPFIKYPSIDPSQDDHHFFGDK